MNKRYNGKNVTVTVNGKPLDIEGSEMDEEHVMNTEQKIKELMRRTSRGQIACGISLELAGGDIEAAIERMKVAYPNMEVTE